MANSATEALIAQFDQFLQDEAIAQRVVDFVAANPMTLQQDIYLSIGVGKEEATRACYFLDVVGRLERIRRGRSYVLSLPS